MEYRYNLTCIIVCLKMLDTTFNNISVIVVVSFIGGETGGPGENHRPVASH
jgi:hypothetical protein